MERKPLHDGKQKKVTFLLAILVNIPIEKTATTGPPVTPETW